MPASDRNQTNLTNLYKNSVSYKTIADISEQALSESSILSHNSSIEQVRSVFSKYGQNKIVRIQNYEEVCET